MTSTRYTHIDSAEVSLHLHDLGWQRHSFAGSSRHSARHRITYRNASRKALAGVATPELVLINSADGGSSARLHVAVNTQRGRTTALCGDHFFSTRHRIDGEERIVEQAPALIGMFEQVESDINAWKGRALSVCEMEEYARLAAQARYRDGWTYEPETLLATRWDEPDGNDLWSVFCRLHANLVRGGFRGVAASGQGVTALPLSCIERDSKFNQIFWQLTKEML